jgi:hypothetical protein
MKTVLVKKMFHDKLNTAKRYNVGGVVKFEDAERVKVLVSIGLVEVVPSKTELEKGAE